MRKIYTLILALFISISFSFGQQSFSFSPVQVMDTAVNLNGYYNFQIDMINNTGQQLTLAWERTEFDWHTDWTYTLCDLGGCYAGIPESGEMLTMEPDQSGYLRITMNPHDWPYDGSVTFYVFDAKDYNDGNTCTFIVHAGTLTAIAENGSGNEISIYPNPATSYIKVQNPLNIEETASIFALNGQKIKEFKISAVSELQIDISDLPKGTYVLNYLNNREQNGSKLVIR